MTAYAIGVYDIWDAGWRDAYRGNTMELVAEQWNEAGLNTTVKLVNRDLYWPRAIGNQVMIPVWGLPHHLVEPLAGVINIAHQRQVKLAGLRGRGTLIMAG